MQGWMHILPFVLTTVFSTGLAIWILSRRRQPSSTIASVMLLAMAEWTMTLALEIIATDLPSKLLWHKLQFIGVAVLPTGWLWYVLRFVGLEKLVTRWRAVMVYIIPAVVLTLALTNDVHGLVWTDASIAAGASLGALKITRGPAHWLYVVHTYVVMGTGTALLIKFMNRRRRSYRWQTAALLFAGGLPSLASLIDILSQELFPTLNATPLSLTATAIVGIWTVFRLRLGNLVPVAQKAVVESMNDGVIVLDDQNTVMDVNPAVECLSRQPAREAVGRPLEQVWPELAHQLTLIEHEDDDTHELAISIGDTRLTLDVHVSPLADWQDRTVGRVVVMRDITHHKRIEQALREAEHDKALVLDSISESVTFVDPEMRILWSNRAAAEATSPDPNSMVGRYCYEICQQQDKPCDECPVQIALGTGQAQKGKVVTADQQVLNVRAYPVRGDSSQVVGAVKVTADITEMEVLERQFLKAQKMEAVGRLAGGVAHDFNNLLTAITGYTHLILSDPEITESTRADLGEIEKAADRAAKLTRQLLAFARRQMLQPELLNLNMVVEDLSKMIHRLVGEDIEFVTHLDPDLGHVRADPGQIEQVIMNLIVNARDAMPKGGKLTIQTQNIELDWTYAQRDADIRPGSYAMLAISDTGMGMEEETMSNLFEPFFTTKEQGKGTGLGLPTVYGIVRQHDGYVWPYSEPGQGTTFKIYLPLVDPASGKGQTEDETASWDASSREETILLAEDEQAVRALTRTVLERRGYTVLAARNGEEALALSQEHSGPIHLLVTDVIMPGINGRELADRLTALHPEARVLFTSGHTEEAISQYGALNENLAFLHKPFAPDTLARTVRQVLSGEYSSQRRAV